MTREPHISDEMLIAYLDGELDEAGMDAVDAALAEDPGLTGRMEAHAALATRVRAAYAPVIDEPVPAALTALVQSAENKVVSLAERRKLKTAPVWWGAIAATFVVGVLLFGREIGSAGPLGAGMTARGDLARALTVQASNDRGAPVSIGLTFKDQRGRYCRTFSADEMSGLACREGEAWKVEVAARQPKAAEGEFRTAASETPPAVLDQVDALIAGETLDAGQEAAALKGGWR